MPIRLPRQLRELDQLLVEVIAIGVAATVGQLILYRAANSDTARRLDTIPGVGQVVAGVRAATGKVVNP